MGIPSYRDYLVVDTVKSLFANASDKSRVYIHIFLQHDLSDSTDSKTYEQLKELQSLHGDSLSIEDVSHKDAKNAYYARYRVQQRYKN